MNHIFDLIDFNYLLIFLVLEISLPSNHQNELEKKLPLNEIFDPRRMHIGAFNLNKNLQQTNAESSGTMNEGILKEINKNTSGEGFKVHKKHKLGNGSKKFEQNVLCGKKLQRFMGPTMIIKDHFL